MQTYLYIVSFSSYPVWIGPFLGKLWTISTARSNCASMRWRDSWSIATQEAQGRLWTQAD